MTVHELLTQLRKLEVRISVEGSQVRVSAPPGALSQEIWSDLKAHKEEIREFLEHAVRSRNGEARLPAIRRAERSGRVPLSFAQKRLWFLAQMEGVSEAYHIPFGVRLQGELNRTALVKALDRIIARHEALRTTFVMEDGEPEQRIGAAEESRFHLVEHDLRKHADAESELKQFIEQEAAAPFDLENGPLIRGRLLRQAEQDHVLLITMHHIVSDGWSMGVMLNELSALYAAFMRGEHDALPPLEVQYADYAVWQREWMEGEKLEEQAEYWRKNLAGVAEVLELPADHVRPERQSFAGGMAELVLEEKLTAGLRELSARHGTTLYMTLLAGWAVLLGRLSGQRDVVIGTPVANRSRVEIEELIGFFVNTLAVRIDLSGSPTVEKALKRVKEQAIGAQQHQDIPFEQVVEMVQPVRSLAHSPLFQVVFAWQNVPRNRPRLKGLEVGPLQSSPHVIAKFDVTLLLRESGERIVGGMEYATALFEPATMERYANYYRRLLEEMVRADAGQTMDRLPMLPEAERRQLLYGWNEPQAKFSRERCVHELFEEQVRRTPDAVALVFEGTTLSYAELNRRANRLAHYLRELGVRPEKRVAICVERSLEMMVAVLGVLKAGGGYVPLDPAYPVERLQYMLEDSAPVVLLSEGNGEELCAGVNKRLGKPLPVVDITDWNWPWAEQPETNVEGVGIKSEHLAYIIYTSGSTGTPKGVMVEHGNVSRLFAATERWFQFSERDVWTLFHSYAFDFSVWEMWGALQYGGRLIVVSRETARSPEDFYGLVCGEKVTVLSQTPSAFRQLIRAQAERGEAHQLRYVIFGGEELEVASLRPWYEQNEGGRTRLVNMYGITETTVHVTYRELERGDVERRGGSPIGWRIPDLRIYILDGEGEAVPVGVVGELYVGGAGVARGYLNRAELTAERFVVDGYGEEAGARMYRTGDVGRWRGEGRIEFLGRNDSQVKIRGFRIELGEIEARLGECEGVGEAVVVVREDEPGEKRLVAYYTGEAGEERKAAGGSQETAEGEAEKLRRWLAEQLPEYMVPAAYVRLERIPLTANGKLDRKGLPAPEADAFAAQQYEAPIGEIETAVAEIWAEVLKVERAGRHDNFFVLGGDSMRVIAVIARVRERGWRVTAQDVFLYQTIVSLANAISAASNGASLAPPESIPLISVEDRALLPADIEDGYGLSYLQLGMIHHAQLTPELSVYHDVFSYHVKIKDWDPEAFQAVLNALAERHPVLRTSIALHRFSQPLQLVHRKAAIPVTVCDISRLDSAAQEQAISECIEQEKKTPFDLVEPPLLRVFIHVRSGETLQYTLSFHHAILDGWSVASFQTELFEEYAKLRARRVALVLPPLAATFKTAVALERQALDSEQAKSFWKSYLADPPPSLLPVFQPDQRPDCANKVELRLPATLRDGLLEVANALGVPVRTVFLATHMRVSSMLFGSQDVVTGLVSHTRPHERDGEKVLGLFLNTLPFRMDLRPGSWKELIQATFDSELSVVPYRSYPYFQLFLENDRVPLFSTVFNYVDFHVYDRLHQADVVEVLGRSSFEQTNFEMVAYVIQDQGALRLRIAFDPQKLSSTQAENIAGYYLAVLQTIASHPNALHHQNYLPETERRQLLYEWNKTATQIPNNKCAHELFEEQVSRTPNATAVVFEGTGLTYAELNARSNQLARYLRSLGVKPDARVGICVERSLEMVIGFLGILKAGGAYVPLDPGYPAERLQFLVENASIKMLLTQERLKALLPGSHAHVLCLDADRFQYEHQPAENLPSCTTPENLAYIIYTSGSSGLPKATEVPHGSIPGFIFGVDYAGFNSSCVLLQHSSVNWDALALELWPALFKGGSTVLFPGRLLTSADLDHYVQRHGVNTLWLTSALFNSIVEENPESFKGIEQLLVGGEAVSAAHVRRVYTSTAGIRIVNGYGPSECTVFSNCYPIPRTLEAEAKAVPIGRPIGDRRVYILDHWLNPVPAGVTGELYISGPSVARGYLGQQELTAEKFIPDPLSSEAGSRMYRTGDLARWIGNGNAEFLGRADHQVKVRGFRIELGEIEARLAQSPGVGEAVVIVREDMPGEKRLVAYYTVAEEHATEAGAGAEELREYLSRGLPEYMVPAAYVRIKHLPLTANGKINRKALPVPESDAYATCGYEEPVGEMEKTMAGIWADVLKLERVGRRDNFFVLGGHSLMAVTLIERMRQRGLHVDVRALFRTPTVCELTATLGLDTDAATVPMNRIPESAEQRDSSKEIEIRI